jgi:hypothetical protein
MSPSLCLNPAASSGGCRHGCGEQPRRRDGSGEGDASRRMCMASVCRPRPNPRRRIPTFATPPRALTAAWCASAGRDAGGGHRRGCGEKPRRGDGNGEGRCEPAHEHGFGQQAQAESSSAHPYLHTSPRGDGDTVGYSEREGGHGGTPYCRILQVGARMVGPAGTEGGYAGRG